MQTDLASSQKAVQFNWRIHAQRKVCAGARWHTGIGLRTIDLPAGETQLTLWFAPQSWRIGLGAAAVGILLCLWLLFRYR